MPTALGVDRSPSSTGDKSHDVGLGEAAFSEVVAGLYDSSVVVPDLEAEPVLAEILPNVLSRVEPLIVGRQREQRNVAGTIKEADPCQPAPSSTEMACSPGASAAPLSERDALMASVLELD